MARIRSIHPGLWTDEAFVSVSPLARLLFMGLWNEADDQGVFEWKPITLKMRLLAADSADVPALLAEMASVGMIRRFEASEKAYGAIRNFRRFQRPEKPKAYHPLPDEIAEFVALSTNNHTCSKKPQAPLGDQSEDDRHPSGDVSEGAPRSVADQSPTDPRSEGQMEEEGGNREREESSSLRSERGEAAPEAGPAQEAPDARKVLFGEGLSRLMRLTGKPDRPARSLMGGMLRDLGDDAAGLSLILAQAEADRPADPIAWLKRAVASRAQGSPGGRSAQSRERRDNVSWMLDPEAFERVLQ